MEGLKTDYLKNHHIITTDDTNGGSKLRKNLAHTHDFSNKYLDEATNCYLLEKNLGDLYKNSENCTNEVYDTIKKELAAFEINGPVNLQSSLTKSNIGALLQSKPCECTKSFNHDQISKVLEALQCKENRDNASTSKSGLRHVPKSLPISSNFQSKEKQIKPVSNERSNPAKITNSRQFKTASDELQVRSAKQGSGASNVAAKRTLGIRRNVNSKFVSPLLSSHESNSNDEIMEEPLTSPTEEVLKAIDKKMIEMIRNEIMDMGSAIEWDDIAGLDFAKNSIQEAVVWPMMRPDIFKGLRRPPKGILLFGPPGTGKTLIGKCIASQSKSTFFSISASSLTSKWIGEGEKMVRALFAVARCHQPAVIFIDEIDSLLCQRSESEHESSRRMKTEFLVQLDGATTDSEERLLLIGATNRPQELDEAARRRFVKRLYIPLPNFDARLQLVSRLVSGERHELTKEDFLEIARKSEGYSGADLKSLCSEASLGPIRSIGIAMIERIQADEVRPLQAQDFENAFLRVRSSVAPKDLHQYVTWDQTYGAGI